MEKSNQTGAKSSKLDPEELGPIYNLSEKLSIEKLIGQSKTWEEVAERLLASGLYKSISGNVIGRLLLLCWRDLVLPTAAVPETKLGAISKVSHGSETTKR